MEPGAENALSAEPPQWLPQTAISGTHRPRFAWRMPPRDASCHFVGGFPIDVRRLFLSMWPNISLSKEIEHCSQWIWAFLEPSK